MTWHVLEASNILIRSWGICFAFNDFFFTNLLRTEYLSTSVASQVEKSDYVDLRFFPENPHSMGMAVNCTKTADVAFTPSDL